MTITSTPLIVETAALETVTFDIYRNIHKGIRYGLFSTTVAAGQVDPHDEVAVKDLAARWTDLVSVLIAHAEHEDDFVLPTIASLSPEYAAEIEEAHPRLERQMAELEVLADRAVDCCPEQARLLTHRLYLGLASFTAEYVQHQEFEEFEVMVMLSQHLSFDELLAIDNAIVASITPDMMAKSAALMLPAMNIEDQVELYEGARAGVPPEIFAGMVALGESVLEPARYQLLAQRLGI
jgi:hypothetical protein